ncbi:PREDICTED: uncharacterized protein LOC105555722 [Vollenhovia emeryi]|uniref:uncharacterized protein LOC105555722 n=1 Tax=Vollenhovia emeryi TaxID=411798 RepID=UPI0005F4D1BD|nr:PREDICTED: uncharacterized protein LOC105555722 [Vollenhovia emeryi]
MPNLGGPCGRTRRLYANVTNSIALYGAPIWSAALNGNKKATAALRKTQRRMAIRAIRGLGGPGNEEDEEAPQPPDKEGGKGGMADLARGAKPSGPAHGPAILPCLDEWLDRSWSRASYRTTQVLTGHGCFGEYLHRIGREQTAHCHHCDGERDSAQHTLEVCPAWANERRALSNIIGADLSLPAVIKAATEREEAWEAFSSFCEHVMLQKEEAERIRRGEAEPRGGSQRGRVGVPQRRGARRLPVHLRAW